MADDITLRRERIGAALAEAGIGSSVVLQAVISTIYSRDPEMLVHVTRVGRIAPRIGREFGMIGRELLDLQHAGWLHDLGRLLVPDITGGDPSAERALECRQLQEVYDLLAPWPYLKAAAEFVLASRESYDGSGCPGGLRGEEIPLGGRILRVADTFDAVGAVESEIADRLAVELIHHAGSWFDPDVIAAWLRCGEWPPRPAWSSHVGASGEAV